MANIACFGLLGAEANTWVFDSPSGLQSWMHADTTDLDPGSLVAWWIADRDRPTPDEAVRRRAFLHEHGPSPYAFPPAQQRERLLIERTSLDDANVQMLIAQLNADLLARYPEPGALIFSLDPDDIVPGVGALLIATVNDRPVGCGAFKLLAGEPHTAEVKRMYVAPSARGQKIGAAVLTELEARAQSIGASRFVLDTGPRQPESLRRFERAGYVRCSPWGEFVGKELSICMSKSVA